MDKDRINTEYIQDLIEKYLEGKATLIEMRELINYYESFQMNSQWSEEIGSKENIRTRMLTNILKEVQTKDIKKIPLYKRKVFRYAIAVSLILFVSVNIVLNRSSSIVNNKILTESDIKAGSDKAILTLENGESISLGKGEDYVSNNLISNGSEIVYNSSSVTKSKISYNYLTVPRGGQYHLILADGTKVWLNSDSKLKYYVSIIVGEPRIVELVYGEAYFDVMSSEHLSGSSFRVVSQEQKVEVLGTEFNIKAYQDESKIYTTLVEGEVVIENGSVYKLEPGQKAILDKASNSFVISQADIHSDISWRDGLFNFKNLSLKDIMTVLSRWYDVEVNFKNEEIENVRFNGVLSKYQNLDSILETIQKIGFINKFEIENKNVIIE